MLTASIFAYMLPVHFWSFGFQLTCIMAFSDVDFAVSLSKVQFCVTSLSLNLQILTASLFLFQYWTWLHSQFLMAAGHRKVDNKYFVILCGANQKQKLLCRCSAHWSFVLIEKKHDRHIPGSLSLHSKQQSTTKQV